MHAREDGSSAVESVERTLSAFGVDRVQLEAIARARDALAIDPEALVQAFYGWLQRWPWKQAFFPTGVAPAVRSAQVGYWREFLAGRVDEAYLASRQFVGTTHARIGLPPKAYTAGMAFSEQWLTDTVARSSLEASEKAESIAAISALCRLDSALVVEAYALHSGRLIQEQAARVADVNTEVSRVVVAASRGDFSERYRIQGESDAELGGALNEMFDSFDATIRQVRAVANGDYSSSVVPRSEADQLGRVLSEMTQKLREATERTERDRWLKQGQADLFERMRGELEIAELAQGVLEYVAERLGAPVGAIYASEAGGDLELAATYGVLRDVQPKTLKEREGVAGEVARKQQPLFDLEVRHSPVVASYGLGELILTNVTLLPFVANGVLTGLIQLATAEKLTAEQREFLTAGAENIAIGLAGAQGRREMRRLLERSQEQGEELQAQAEELRTTNEELQERGRALHTAREELEARNQELQGRQREIERAQEALEHRAQQLSSASKYKSEFLANMSHELRTPLNSMLLIVESLSGNPSGNLSDKQLESLSIVEGGARDLLRIINDILDLSKVEAGRLRVAPAATALEDLLGALRGQFEPVATAHRLELSLQVEPSAPGVIVTDGHRVQQILTNLLANALKFTHEGSVRLTVAAAERGTRFARQELAAERAVAISVTDTGIGISSEKQQAIFEAFQQADGSTSRRYGGTGLGLAVSRQLARLLGGEIQLSSEPGKGSTFTLYLPHTLREEEQPSQEAELPPPSSRLEMSVRPGRPVAAPAPLPHSRASDASSARAPVLLLVEDDSAFAHVLSTEVRELGYECVVARCGKDALLMAQKLEPQGVILDLGLPDIDGMRVLRQLKSDLKLRHIPVHVISGHACRSEALQMGAMGFLQKPADQSSVHAMFQRFEHLWARAGGRILVVEDDAGSQRAIRELLGGQNVHIDMVPTGGAGLAMLEENRYDCIVIDLGLPDMDGREFLEKLQEEHPPVVVYTAQDLDDRRLAELAGCSHSVVLKGARSPERLLDEVSLFLHQVEDGLSDEQRRTLNKIQNESDVLSDRKVLVVDDDMRNLYAMTELLQRHGIEVIKAKNGNVALEQLDAREDIDLVIMDIMMPVMDGFEAMRRIRSQPRHASLPIIALTAKTLQEDRQACLEAGASDYIAKPMDSANLLALMRILLFDSRRDKPASSRPSSSAQAGGDRACG